MTRLALALSCTAPMMLQAQAPELPFGAGEELRYRVSAGKLGSIGEGVMSVSGPIDVRGTATLALRSDVHARVGLVKTSERAESWIDPARMTALRYAKRTRGPFSRGDHRVLAHVSWNRLGNVYCEPPFHGLRCLRTAS